jgi:predicted nucleic acid-binding protein
VPSSASGVGRFGWTLTGGRRVGSARIGVEVGTRYVIDGGTTLQLASEAVDVPAERELYAPTLWRSETLSALYEAVRRGEVAEDAAREQLAYVNGLKIRLLGDAVLRRRAWKVAEELGLETTFQAEYIALAQLQKCTLVSGDAQLVKRVGDLVPTATLDALR